MELNKEQIAEMQANQELNQLLQFNIPLVAENLVRTGALKANKDGTFSQTKMTNQQRVATNKIMEKMMASAGLRGANAQPDGSFKFIKNAVEKFREATLKQMLTVKLVNEAEFEQAVQQNMQQEMVAEVAPEIAVEAASLPDLSDMAPVQSEMSMKDIIQNLSAINDAHPPKANQKMSKEANLATKDFIMQIMVDMGHPAVAKKNGYSPKQGQYNKYDAAKVDVKEIHKFHDEMVAVMKGSSDLNKNLSLIDGQLSTFKTLQADEVAEKLQEHGYLQRNEQGELERRTPANDAVSRGRRERFMTQLMGELGDSAVSVNKRNELSVSKENLRAFEENLVGKFAPAIEAAAPAQPEISAEAEPQSLTDALQQHAAQENDSVQAEAPEQKKGLMGRIISMIPAPLRKVAAVALLFGAGYLAGTMGNKDTAKAASASEPKAKTTMTTTVNTAPVLTSVKAEVAKPVIASVKKHVQAEKKIQAEVEPVAQIRQLPELDPAKSPSIVIEAPKMVIPVDLKLAEIKMNSESISHSHRTVAGRIFHAITHPFERAQNVQQDTQTQLAVEKSSLPSSVNQIFQNNKMDTTKNTNTSSTVPGLRVQYSIK